MFRQLLQVSLKFNFSWWILPVKTQHGKTCAALWAM